MEDIKSLEAELKLLRWHKLANESALKAAIIKEKQTKRIGSSDRNNMPQLTDGSTDPRREHDGKKDK